MSVRANDLEGEKSADALVGQTVDERQETRVTRRSGSASRSRSQWLVFLLAFTFIFGPAVAGISGVRAHEFENRPLKPFPDLRGGVGVLPDLGIWATDHLPGREQAVAANTELALRVFDEPASNANTAKPGSYPKVLQGAHGWLFFGDDIRLRCTSTVDAADQVARMVKLGDIIKASGRTFVFTIAPDKTSVYPQYLPGGFLGKACAEASNTAFYAALAANPSSGYVDVRTTLIAEAKKDRATPLYWPRDSHWSAEGISYEMPILAKALDPSLGQGTSYTRSGTYTATGDLTVLLGQPAADNLPAFAIRRKGVTMSPDSDLTLHLNKVTHVTNASTSAPLYQKPTLILGDSFTDSSKKFIAPYFEHLTLLHNRSATKLVADQMAANNTIIVQMAERLAVPGQDLLLSDAALAEISSTLKAHPATN